VDSFFGKNCVIGAGVTVGDGARFSDGTSIAEGARIGRVMTCGRDSYLGGSGRESSNTLESALSSRTDGWHSKKLSKICSDALDSEQKLRMLGDSVPHLMQILDRAMSVLAKPRRCTELLSHWTRLPRLLAGSLGSAFSGDIVNQDEADHLYCPNVVVSLSPPSG
jgi:hypothetical protein